MRSKVQHGTWIGLVLAALLLCVTTTKGQAQTFTTLYSFNGFGGPYGADGLVQATNGDLYGANSIGEASNGDGDGGAIYKITTSGTLTTLYTFCPEGSNDCPAGQFPQGPAVAWDTNGDFYGTTYQGGTSTNCASGCGTVFKITLGGKLTVLHNFVNTDGYGPYGTLILATDGNFYGTTSGVYGGNGTVFKVTPGGTLTTLHTFTGSDGDGATPFAGLIQATNGNFYGTTGGGGSEPCACGTVFKIAPGGTLTTLHSFAGYPTDGSLPVAALVQATNGNLYGTTSGGGPYGNNGTVFEITPSGKYTTVYNFCSGDSNECPDGWNVWAGLIQATDGNLYGTTNNGGTYDGGTIFKITTGGTLTTLWNFTNGTDGSGPFSGLMQDTNGTFYGTTRGGGAYGLYGTVFSLSMGLGPFVETLPTSGKVKTAVTILGTDLTGATSVTFNGKVATFKVVSATQITTTVPTGATTGKVKVKTQSGTLTSNVNFRVP